MDAESRLDQDRLSITLAGAAIGFTLSRVLQFPSRRFGVQVLGSPLGIELSTSWLLTLVVVGLVVTGVHSLLVNHPSARGRRVSGIAVFWALPGLAAMAMGGLLQQAGSLERWLLAMLGGVVVLGVVAINEYRSMDPAELIRPGRQILSTVFVYGVALALFLQIFGTRARVLLIGPLTFVVSVLLAARLFLYGGQPLKRVFLASGVVGLLMVQILWALNYWRIGLLAGSLLLLLVFYLFTSLVHQSLAGRLGRRALIEYAVTLLLAALVIARI